MTKVWAVDFDNEYEPVDRPCPPELFSTREKAMEWAKELWNANDLIIISENDDIFELCVKGEEDLGYSAVWGIFEVEVKGDEK